MQGVELEEQIRNRAAAEAGRAREWARERAVRAARSLRAQQIVAAGVVLFIATALAALDPPLAVAGTILAGILPLSGFAVAHLQRLRRDALAAQAGDLTLSYARGDVERRIRARCQVLLAHVVLTAGIALALLFDLFPHDGWARISLAALLVFCVADAAYGLGVDLPRLHSQRASMT